MTIIIDFREKSDIPTYLSQLNIPTITQVLDFGDYLIGPIPVESKSVQDYISSLLSGHLNNQLYELSTHHNKSILLVHGNPEYELTTRNISLELYYSSLAGSLYKQSPNEVSGVISLITLPSEYHSALFLKYLHTKYLKDEPRLPTPERHQFSELEQAEFTLSTIPSVGHIMARDLLARFGSLYGVCLSSLKDLQTVHGIGEKTAQTIYNYLHNMHTSTVSLEATLKTIGE